MDLAVHSLRRSPKPLHGWFKQGEQVAEEQEEMLPGGEGVRGRWDANENMNF